jgi:hypothetical protein
MSIAHLSTSAHIVASRPPITRSSRPCLAILAATLCWGALHAEQRDERPALTIIPYDAVVLESGFRDLGTVSETADSVIEVQLADGTKHSYQPGSYDHIEWRMTVAKVVKKRCAIDIRDNLPDDAIKTLQWGRETKDRDEALVAAAKEATASVAMKAMATWPDNIDLAATIVVPQMLESGDRKGVETLARHLVGVDPHWSAGYDYVARMIASDQSRTDELIAWLTEWVRIQPTAFKPNHDLAHLHEAAGDVRRAQEEYRTCSVIHQDPESSLGYARTSLARGDLDIAARVAADLSTNGQFASEAVAIAGSAKLAQGDTAGALPLLETAAAGRLIDETATIAHYNLGVAYLRTGNLAQARVQWTRLGALPLARLALAILDRKPFPDIESLPVSAPGLKEMARMLNACVDLEHGRSAAAFGLDAGLDARHHFLGQLATLVLNGGSRAEAIVRDLNATPGIEAQRWQVYGLLLARRYAEAEAALAHLPADDGYCLAYRVCVAEGLNEPDLARSEFIKLDASPQAPREWTERARRALLAGHDTFIDEKFNWPTGDLPNDGWQFSAPGTGIRIHCAGAQLVFNGTQSANPNPVSRAWMMVQETRFRQATLDLDVTGMAGATGGIEVLDPGRQNGVQLGVQGDSRLAWRALKAGIVGEWQPLGVQIQGTHATLCIDYSLGRVMAFMADEPLRKFPLGDGLGQAPPEQLCLGVFGTAEPGMEWTLIAQRMQVQLKPLTGPGSGSSRLGDRY